MRLRPTKNKALIRVEIPDDVSDGGIALPVDRKDDPKDNPNIGIVLALGETDRTPECKVGDRVLFTDFYESATGEKGVYVVDQSDIAAVMAEA